MSGKIPYLLKPGRSQNDPKPAKPTLNQPKRPKKFAKRPETTQHFKIEELWNFLLVFTFEISTPNAQIWAFWAIKSELSNRNEIVHVSYFEDTDFKFDIGFENFEPKCSNLGILRQKISTF